MKVALNQLVADNLSYIPDEPPFSLRIITATARASSRRRIITGSSSGPTALDIYHLAMGDFRQLFGERSPDTLTAEERVAFYELLRS
jgi:hypothetical protein